MDSSRSRSTSARRMRSNGRWRPPPSRTRGAHGERKCTSPSPARDFCLYGTQNWRPARHVRSRGTSSRYSRGGRRHKTPRGRCSGASSKSSVISHRRGYRRVSRHHCSEDPALQRHARRARVRRVARRRRGTRSMGRAQGAACRDRADRVRERTARSARRRGRAQRGDDTRRLESSLRRPPDTGDGLHRRRRLRKVRRVRVDGRSRGSSRRARRCLRARALDPAGNH